MALQSPALTLSIEALFGHIRPALDLIDSLGPTDFSSDAPGIDVKPGATIKIPLSTVEAAKPFVDSAAATQQNPVNNYLTGGYTEWASLTATHYLQGFDIKGVNIDQGVNAARMKQLFSKRAGVGIAMAVKKAIRTALDNTTTIPPSTAVQIPAVASVALSDYDGLAHAKDWYDPAEACLVVNGTEYATIKKLMHAAHLSATPESIAAELGFKKVIVLAGLTRRACIVPYSSIGFIARVPALIADFDESGVETDEKSGLSLGIVVASEKGDNKRVVNGDLWFGCATVGSAAGATDPGIIGVGTAS
ncbi:MAG: hypothetical protein IKB52_01585 [Kiritimatiellae bacterium]|nr:hypothetical protein [Kiritimatiellia bacterium]